MRRRYFAPSHLRQAAEVVQETRHHQGLQVLQVVQLEGMTTSTPSVIVGQQQSLGEVAERPPDKALARHTPQKHIS